MFKPRPCGCKGQRTCKICEEHFGAWKLCDGALSDEQKKRCCVFCPLCEKVFPGWETSAWKEHPNHAGDGRSFQGVKLYLDFITTNEETDLLRSMDEVPWDLSQSGRLKQNYGPKCNFKKRKARIGSFSGYPRFTKFIQDRFREMPLLHDFQTVEQCSLDYTTERGSSIDPHIDDCWIWGERIPTLSLISDSCLTLTKYGGNASKYNLSDTLTYPTVVDANGRVKTLEEIRDAYDSLERRDLAYPLEENGDLINKSSNANFEADCIIRVPMPRRSLIVLYGKPRYDWLHAILRQDISTRRACITYRELSPPFLSFGKYSEVGKEILMKSENFWDHLDLPSSYSTEKDFVHNKKKESNLCND